MQLRLDMHACCSTLCLCQRLGRYVCSCLVSSLVLLFCTSVLFVHARMCEWGANIRSKNSVVSLSVCVTVSVISAYYKLYIELLVKGKKVNYLEALFSVSLFK